MNYTLAILLLMLLAAIAAPTLTANPAGLSAEPESSIIPTNANRAPQPKPEAKARPVTADPPAVTPAPAATQESAEPPITTRLANKERSRRPARIDMTMPFYRFGRLPIRIKD